MCDLASCVTVGTGMQNDNTNMMRGWVDGRVCLHGWVRPPRTLLNCAAMERSRWLFRRNAVINKLLTLIMLTNKILKNLVGKKRT